MAELCSASSGSGEESEEGVEAGGGADSPCAFRPLEQDSEHAASLEWLAFIPFFIRAVKVDGPDGGIR